jgi:hypothetical protein
VLNSRNQFLGGWNQRFFMVLGAWHSLKMASYLLFRESHSILGRFYFEFFPLNKSCLKKPSHQEIQNFYNHLFLGFKENHTEWMEMVSNESDLKLDDNHKNLIHNLNWILTRGINGIKDYACSIRLNNFEMFKTQKLFLIQFFILFDCYEYFKVEYLNMLIMKDIEENNQKFFEFYKNNINLFNEEIHEVAFSALTSRMGKQVDSFEPYNNMFKSIKLHSELSLNFNPKLTKKNQFRSDRFKTIDKEEVDEAAKVFKKLMLEIKENRFLQVNIGSKKVYSMKRDFEPLKDYQKFDFKGIGKKLKLKADLLMKNLGSIRNKPNYTDFIDDLFFKEKEKLDE